MKINQVAAQMYTCRAFLQSPADIAKSLKKIKEIGYAAVQMSGQCQIDDHELCKMIEGEGLICCATHESPDMILKTPEAVVEKLNNLKCKYTAYPWPQDIDFGSEDDVAGLIKGLDAAGKVLADAGQILTYHNHHMECRRLNGQVILERIYDETNPAYLQGEIDSYWLHYGGCENVSWCNKLSGRLPLFHMKDYMITDKNEITFAEIGNGNLSFKDIIPAAEAAGCEWFIIEQDECPVDPFESLKISLDYVAENLCDLPVAMV
ncbi:Inosose dehydratase [Poriferisphaera corsica]|uniref:Inosose dehydratase n=1 Tax=Poriferisphaera corsica TaxID=2528020 RepID=A0A517YYG0_9BACT|nr:sugar phosphate isomerase/epimerase [Poriferisphaera corsica]QDU35263.1 Inosose dehydratase [Poriferisphaera corsica]